MFLIAIFFLQEDAYSSSLPSGYAAFARLKGIFFSDSTPASGPLGRGREEGRSLEPLIWPFGVMGA